MSAAQKWCATAAALVVALVLAILLRSSDSASGPRYFPRCGFHALSGLHCPGCGNTRASRALLHGDVGAAVRQNPLFVVGLPFLLFAAANSWAAWVFPGRWKSCLSLWRRGHTLVVVGIVVGFGVLRNLPQRPFSWLAPEPPESIKETQESGVL